MNYFSEKNEIKKENQFLDSLRMRRGRMKSIKKVFDVCFFHREW
jgi:hypothetical protein